MWLTKLITVSYSLFSCCPLDLNQVFSTYSTRTASYNIGGEIERDRPMCHNIPSLIMSLLLEALDFKEESFSLKYSVGKTRFC